MSTIRPANFPRIETTQVQRPPRPVRTPPQPAPQPQATQKVRKAVIQSPPRHLGRVAGATKTNKQVKLEKAIEVLRAKSIQLYQPDSTKIRQSVALGQIIDIKV
ncbi:MAG: hypothetical protein ACE5IY_04055 [bacterium]